MWRGLAELAERLLTKGKMVYIEGKLTTRKWQDQQGQSRRTTEVVANNFQILEKRDSPGPGNTSFPNAMNEPAGAKPLTAATAPIPQNPLTAQTPNTAQPVSKPATDAPVDDLPF